MEVLEKTSVKLGGRLPLAAQSLAERRAAG
jgi:hypothetical protein